MCSSDVSLLPTQAPLMNTASPLCKNDFRERCDLMSLMLTIGLFVRRHPVALLCVSTDLPARMTQKPCPDRFVRAKRFTAATARLAIRTNRPSLFFDSLDGTLSRIGCRTVLRCRLKFHKISRQVFHLVCQSHRCRLSVTPQSYVLVKETLNEFDQSSGKVVSGLLSQKGMTFTNKQVSVDSNQSRGIFLFCFSTGRPRMQNRRRSQGAVLPSRASHYGDVGHLSHVP